MGRALTPFCLLLTACYASHGVDDPGEPLPVFDAGIEEVFCSDEPALTLTLREGVDCTSGWVMASGSIDPFQPSGTAVRLVREVPAEGVQVTIFAVECSEAFRVWEVSSSMSACDNAMSWAPEGCEPGLERTRTWRWTAGDRESAELLFAGEGGFEVSLCQ